MASATILQNGKVLYAYNGTSWVPLNTTGNLVNSTRWQKVAAGGETTLSGNDDSGESLIYTPGFEQVYLNGVLLARDSDYTATTGTMITGLAALTAGYIVEVTVDMSKLSIKEIDETKLNRNNEYEFVLPKTNTPIKFKIMTHSDELVIAKDVEASEKISKQGNEIQARYRRIITEVNGNRDLGYISNFVANQLLAADSKALRKYINQISPNIDLVFDYTSPFTGETEALSVPVGIDFFYPAD